MMKKGRGLGIGLSRLVCERRRRRGKGARARARGVAWSEGRKGGLWLRSMRMKQSGEESGMGTEDEEGRAQKLRLASLESMAASQYHYLQQWAP